MNQNEDQDLKPMGSDCTGYVYGEVTDRPGSKLQGVTITVTNSCTTTTDSNGKYSTEENPVDCGSYDVSAELKDYVTETSPDKYVNSGGNLCNFTLSKGGYVYGKVTDKGGNKLKDAGITVTNASDQNVSCTATTDNLGNYSTESNPVATGTYNVTVELEDYVSGTSTVESLKLGANECNFKLTKS